MFNRYLGHSDKISQIRALESYQLMFSLSSSGDLLIHDIRSGECIRGIKTSAVHVFISSLGLILFQNLSSLDISTINGSKVLKKNIKITKGLFDSSGENFYYFHDQTWGFFNLFDDHKKFEKTEDLKIVHLVLPFQNEYLIHSQVSENTSFVFTFETINKEPFRVIPRHNILRD